MANRHTKKLSFLFGAATGALVAYFLMSEEGRKWKAETTKRFGQFSRRMSDQAQEQLDYISRSMDIFVENRPTEEQEVTLSETDIDQIADRVESSFKRGMKSGQK
ncbi:MAG: YtxH domain-containing protein [Bacteroidota bacterium]